MNTANILLQLARYQQTGKPALIPCLVGPTGCGKTQRVIQLAQAPELALKGVVRLLLGQHLPEDIGGIPRISQNHTGWVTDFALTRDLHRAVEEPVLLFLDEIDKARPEVHATVLTLKADRIIRDQKLHPGTVIVAAGQPVSAEAWLSDETHQALSARMVWLKQTHDWDYVRKEVNMPLAWLQSTDPAFIAPILPANSRSMTRIIQFLQWAGLSLSNVERETIIRGTLAGGDADNLLNEMSASSWLDLEVAFANNPLAALDALDLNSLCEASGTMMTTLSDLKVFEQAFRKVFLNPDSTPEHKFRFMDNLFKTLEKKAPNQGDTVELLPNVNEEEFHTLMVKLVSEYNAVETPQLKVGKASAKQKKVTTCKS
jgi:hypothetical protein